MIDMTGINRPLTKAMAQEWITALRSGKFRQGQNCLTSWSAVNDPTPKHCCLGVANEIFGLGFSPSSYGLYGLYDVEKVRLTLLPVALQNELMARNDGRYHRGTHHTKYSFPEIADYIEQDILPNLP